MQHMSKLGCGRESVKYELTIFYLQMEIKDIAISIQK